MDIKKNIKQRGSTVADVAAALGVSRQALGYQLAAETVPLRRLQDIAHIIGCTPADLLSEGNDTPTADGPTTTTDFAALVVVGGRTYQPGDIGELLQLAQQLTELQQVTNEQTAAADWQPVRRRRVLVSADASTTADTEDTTAAD